VIILNDYRKPLLKSDDLINHMENRGIHFDVMSQEDALSFLKKNNNYFKLTSYRKNFPKYQEGTSVGKYIDLDFAYLVDLSTIDMHFRSFLLKMTLDIEHYIKINLLQSIEENKEEDGYKIVDAYIASKEDGIENPVIRDIRKQYMNPYCGELLDKYGINNKSKVISNFPVWAFIEVIPFGRLREFYEFYHTYYIIKDRVNAGFLLRSVNQLRNAVAHNNCIINNLYPLSPKSVRRISTDNRVSNFLTEAGINSTMKRTKMKNPRINQIVTTFYLFDNVVTSDRIKKYKYEELNKLVTERMVYHREYYHGNPTIKTAFEFLEKISNHLYGKH
jgi:abortive infection bacteriophage resistance protein